jgi:centromere protein C
VVFSPTGIPIANREYESRPLSEYIEGSPDDKNVRRSKRARCAPLAFWKNEQQVYGAHEETGQLGEAMGDMPVVKEVLKALPTPYRKRKGMPPPKAARRKGSRHETETEALAVVEDETYDSAKIRKKYNYVDGESAHLWDDSADDSADLSKCLLLSSA